MNETAATPVVTDVEQSLCVRCGLCCDGTLLSYLAVSDDSDPTGT